jgi:hypothetical protein
MIEYLITVCGINRISEIKDGWFRWKGKMMTKNCQSKPLTKVKVRHKEDSTITGVAQEYGLLETGYLYVYWDRIPSNKPRPYTFEHIDNLIFEE